MAEQHFFVMRNVFVCLLVSLLTCLALSSSSSCLFAMREMCKMQCVFLSSAVLGGRRARRDNALCSHGEDRSEETMANVNLMVCAMRTMFVAWRLGSCSTFDASFSPWCGRAVSILLLPSHLLTFAGLPRQDPQFCPLVPLRCLFNRYSV